MGSDEWAQKLCMDRTGYFYYTLKVVLSFFWASAEKKKKQFWQFCEKKINKKMRRNFKK